MLGNGWLKQLHAEQLARRSAEAKSPQEPSTSAHPSEVLKFGAWEVVLCNHGQHTGCLQCIGREVEVPVQAYEAFHEAYKQVPPMTRPTDEELRGLAVPPRSLAAGEVRFLSFASLVAALAPARTAHFLDLGSGTGRAVTAWGLLLPEGTATGVEIRQPLHDVATQTVRGVDQLQGRVDLVCGDFFDVAWTPADVLLVNSTGFGDEIMMRISKHLDGLGAQAQVITLSQPIHESTKGWKVAHQAPYRMSWGNATVYIYRRG